MALLGAGSPPLATSMASGHAAPAGPTPSRPDRHAILRGLTGTMVKPPFILVSPGPVWGLRFRIRPGLLPADLFLRLSRQQILELPPYLFATVSQV